MSYTPQAQMGPSHASTPPPPPPKQPSASNTPSRGPPLPPPPPGQYQNQTEPSELDVDGSRPHQRLQQGPSIPNIDSNWLPESLKDKSVDDLHHILDTPSLRSALLSNPSTTHPAVPAAEAHLIPLIQSNVQLSSQLSDTEARLKGLRERIQSRLLSLRALEQQHRTKISETEDALRDFSPQALYQRLNASMQEQELLVRSLEESWLEDDGVASDREVGDFLRRVKDGRKTAFLMRERKARWDEGRVGGWR